MKLRKPPVSRMTHDYVRIPGSPAPIALPKAFPAELANNVARMIHQFYAAPEGHSVVQASDKSIHHVPTSNLAQAKRIDPGLSVLHSVPQLGMSQAGTPQADVPPPGDPDEPSLIGMLRQKQGA